MQLRSLIIVFVFGFQCVEGQSINMYSNYLSASSSPEVMGANNLLFETNNVYYNSDNENTNTTELELHYGLFNLFEVNGTYTNVIQKYKKYVVNNEYKFSGGYLSNVGFKTSLYKDSLNPFQITLAANYYLKSDVLKWGKVHESGNFGSINPDKYIELSFRNILSKKLRINYDLALCRDRYQVSAGCTYNISKRFCTNLDFDGSIHRLGNPYNEVYLYVRPTIAYAITNNILLLVSTSGELDSYYDYSQQGQIGLSWKIK